MEPETNFDQIYQNALPPALKLEKLDDFSMDKNTYLQDFHHLDHQFHLPYYSSSSLNPSVDVQSNSSDPFYPSFVDSCSVYEFLDNSSAAMQSFQECDVHSNNNPNPKDLSTKIETLRMVFPHEDSSCVTADNNNNITGFREGNDEKNSKNPKNTKSSSKIYQSVSTKRLGFIKNKSKPSKGQWTVEEDRILIHLVEKYGVRKWSRIAQMLEGRIGKQCRERWHNHLRPDIKKDLWTEDEDRVLIEAHAEVGNKWAEIAKRLPGRTENSIKNHWNATKRRQLSRRKCRTKWPKPSSLLQNYIKSLHLGKEDIKKSSFRNEANNASSAEAAHPDDIFKNSQKEGVALISSEQVYDRMVSGFEFDEVPDLGFHSYDDEKFDSVVDLALEAPPLMHYEGEEVDFFDGVEDMDAW
ncbi:Transcription factor MYB98 [Striga hermonthica]|uniref:Transcription factor MYB98 n=1 Tax=Striga hermonthica TaxID=68872 RepID=A0A9N7RA93_STRHE|nr:Transcription factor MYB98 [Striga hermonthica]